MSAESKNSGEHSDMLDSIVASGEFGQFRIIGPLGAGAMGTVFSAHDTEQDRVVALKIPRLDKDQDGELRERFFREARAMACVEHPNLCKVYGVGSVGDTIYMALAYIQGKSLKDLLKRGPLGKSAAAGIVKKLAHAVAEMHKSQVVHRDLKPANVIVNFQHEPIVLDFGLAARLDGGKDDLRLTQTGMTVGTPAYMSPEQVDGDLRKIGPPSDIYALGVILFELLTGKLPFTGSMGAVMAKILTEKPPSLSEAAEKPISDDLNAICQKALAKRPQDRFASMEEFAGALDDFLEGRTSYVGLKAIAEEPAQPQSHESGSTQPTRRSPTPAPASPTDIPASSKRNRATLNGGSPALPPRRSRAVRRKKKAKRQAPVRVVGIGAICLLFVLLIIVIPKSGGDATANLLVKVDSTDISQAVVTIDGSEVSLVGPTGEAQPLELPADGKPHQLVIKQEGFDPFIQDFQLEPGERKTVDVQLARSAVVVPPEDLLAPKDASPEPATPDEQPDFFVDLQGVANRVRATEPAENTGLKNLSPQLRGLSGTEFRVGEKFLQVAGKARPELVKQINDIRLGRKAARLCFLQGTEYGKEANGGQTDRGAKIADYIIKYEDGSEQTVPVRYEMHVVDWFQKLPRDLPAAKLAWVGESQLSKTYRTNVCLFKMTWENPFPDLPIATIDFHTTMTRCVPFCVAITGSTRLEKEARSDLPSVPTGESFAWGEKNWKWGTPKRLPATINGPHEDSEPCLSSDGLTLLFASDRPGGLGKLDLYQSTRAAMDAPWGEAVNLGAKINSPEEDSCPCLSADGKLMLWGSNRPGGYGNYDLWMAERESATGKWSSPRSMGPDVNSPQFDVEPTLSADGCLLVFASSRRGGRGHIDLWSADRNSTSRGWGTPANVGSLVNTKVWEGSPTLSSDGLAMFFHSAHGFRMTHRENRNASWSKAEPGRLSGEVRSPSLSIDGKVLYFRRLQREGTNDYDIWMSRRVVE